jgi:hypothetical protein
MQRPWRLGAKVAIIVAPLLVAALLLPAALAIWFWRDRAWLTKSCPDHWLVALRVDGDLTYNEWEGRCSTTFDAVSRQLSLTEHTNGHHTWPVYSYLWQVYACSGPGPLPEAEQVLRECAEYLERDGLTCWIAVVDSKNHLAGPMHVLGQRH